MEAVTVIDVDEMKTLARNRVRWRGPMLLHSVIGINHLYTYL